VTRKLLFALFIALILVLFAVQNAGQVTVNLLFWSFPVSLAVILMVCLFLGALIGSIISVFSLKKKAGKKEKVQDMDNKINSIP